MAVDVEDSNIETKAVSSVQITAFHMNYETGEMTSNFILFDEDGLPFRRDFFSTRDQEEILAFYAETERKIREDNLDIDTASAEVAYSFVISKLKGE
jgi:hypothetical protein